MSVQAPMFNGHFHYHFYPGLAREISDFGPDIVHVDEEPYNFASAHAIWLAQKHSARALFFTWQNLNKRYPPPFSWIEKYCYRQAAAIAGTDGAKDVLREKGFDGQLAVIPQFGVDPEVFHPKSEEFPSSQFTFGYVGPDATSPGVTNDGNVICNTMSVIRSPLRDSVQVAFCPQSNEPAKISSTVSMLKFVCLL